MPGVGRNSYKAAMQKAKELGAKKAAATKRMTGGGYGITRLNSDRPSDSMPSQALNRFNYGFPRMSRNFMEAIEQDPDANASIKKAVAKERAKLDE